MSIFKTFLLATVVVISCNNQIVADDKPVNTISHIVDIPVPIGFKRLKYDSGSFANYLRSLPINLDEPIKYYNGSIKPNQQSKYSIVEIDVGTKDLQQCADATMRLRAEYLHLAGKDDQILFHFTSGHEAKWKDYASGLRPKIKGSQVQFVKTAKSDSSYKSFRNYCDLIFTYCGTASLRRDVVKTSNASIKPGDIYLESRQPYGHAVMVMDVAIDDHGKRIFLLSQSFMPAQSIHVLVNQSNRGLSPWYSADSLAPLQTPEWTFPSGSLCEWR